ncbi:ABC transporter ATP-binding protein [Cereibacter sp. SYSU M97828]|nr:ABC transporter ATP-binding protein [Cereibacter flavus]
MTPNGPVDAVNNVSFRVPRGKTVALVGESGSGKSVTSLAIMRLTPRGTSRCRGSICLSGRELTELSDKAFRQVRGGEIAMIFQEPMTSLNPVLSIGTQLTEALHAHGTYTQAEARTEAIRLLTRVNIPDAEMRVKQYPHNFSGGMRQRVVIAMALASKPKLLIADEPTTALDVTIQAEILSLLKQLQEEEGMSVLFITHDMGVVAEMADETVVMYHGAIVETGETAQIFARPRHPYTKALLASVPRLGAMTGRDRPLRFPVVDRTTGEVNVPCEAPDTVRNDRGPVLQVRGLVKRYDLRSGLLAPVRGRVHAVEKVSFDIRAGETLSLVGESGCGKSTTGRAVTRLIESEAGSVLQDGKDVMALSRAALRDQRRHMQMIFQDPFASLDPTRRVGNAIAEPLLIHGICDYDEARKRVGTLLERVGLSPEMADRFPHEFSGGQRQRICIARALALEPQLIVADESVSALDVSVKAQVVNLMLDLQASMGLSYLFISHDMAVVERVSHRVAVMYLGEIVEIGPRAAIFDRPQHDYTKRLLSAVPVADPGHRRPSPKISNAELKSPIRARDYQPPVRRYRQVGADHFVMDSEGSYTSPSSNFIEQRQAIA